MQKLSDRPASLQKVEAPDRRQDDVHHVVPIDRWRHPNWIEASRFLGQTGSNFLIFTFFGQTLQTFSQPMHTALRIHSRYLISIALFCNNLSRKTSLLAPIDCSFACLPAWKFLIKNQIFVEIYEKVPFETFFLWKFVSIQWISGCLLIKKQIVVRIGVHVVPINIHWGIPERLKLLIDVETTTCTTWFQLTAEASHKVEASVDVF